MSNQATSDILFNSPALHSLKRAQLVQLCKRHNIKASGKNVDLVQRLRCYADAVKRDEEVQMSPFKQEQVVYEDEDEDDDERDEGRERFGTRRSEKWEMIGEQEEMDPFGARARSYMKDETPASPSKRARVQEDGVGEQGELGSVASKSGMTSSLKSLLGLGRTTSTSFNPFKPQNALKRSNTTATPAPAPTEPEPEPDLTVHPLSPTSPSGANASIASIDRPVPGLGGRIGTSSASEEAGGTIRLITPKARRSIFNSDYTDGAPTTGGLESRYRDSLPRLAPYKPTFEIVLPTPGWKGVSAWPPVSPVKERVGEEEEDGEDEDKENVPVKMYPSLRAELESAGLDNEEDEDMSVDNDDTPVSPTDNRRSSKLLQPSTTTTTAVATAAAATVLTPPSNAFVFGSPNPRYSTTSKDFASAASSVLAEMNARLGGGSGPNNLPSIDMTLLQNRKSHLSESEVLNYQFGGAKGHAVNVFGGGAKEGDRTSVVGVKFEKAHEREFERMEGIDAYCEKRMRGKGVDGPLPVNRKRKSDVLGTGLEKGKGKERGKGKVLPGGLGEEDDEGSVSGEHIDPEQEQTEPTSKRIRISSNTNANTNSAKPSLQDLKSESDRLKKDREAIKRTLQLKKARRRSSKVSGVGIAAKTPVRKATTGVGGRFGLGVLASAKSLVKSVWNRGAGGVGMTASAGGAGARKESTLLKPTAASVAKMNVDVASTKTTSSLSVPKPSLGNTTATANAHTNTNNNNNANGTVGSRMSGIARFRAKSPNLQGTGAGMGPPPASNSSGVARPSRTASMSSRSTSIGVGGIGARKITPGTIGSRASSVTTSTTATTARTTIGSRLFAPTASSLAKMREKNANVAAGTGNSAATAATANPSPTKIPRSVLGIGKSGLGIGGGTKPGNVNGQKKRSIFSTPLPLKLQGLGKNGSGKENGNRKDVDGSGGGVANPITGVLSPSKGTNRSNNPSLSQKPRISRGKILTKLGEHRTVSSSDAPAPSDDAGATIPVETTTTTNTITSPNPSLATTVQSPRLTLSAKKHNLRARSSIGAARHGSKALLGIGAGTGVDGGAGAGGVLMSAKKRARRSEVAKRKSARVGMAQVGSGDVEMDMEMDQGSAMELEVDV